MNRGAGPLIIAIDGPAGVGKSTTARTLAARLGVPYLDTGAMYRAVALAALEHGVDLDDPAAITPLAGHVALTLVPRPDGGAEVWLDGRPVGERIRTPEVSDASSRVSAVPAVRRWMVELQRAHAGAHGGVVEGRDIGTRVFPDTPYKFFLTADPAVRHRRRYEELQARGREAPWEDVVAEMAGRDERDASRADSPLQHDASYVVIDTSGLTPEEVVERLLAAIGG